MIPTTKVCSSTVQQLIPVASAFRKQEIDIYKNKECGAHPSYAGTHDAKISAKKLNFGGMQ